MNILPAGNAFLSSPFPWVALAGLFLGATVSRLARRTVNKRNPERARTRKWVFTSLYLSIAILLGLAALFLPRLAAPSLPWPATFLDIRLAWVTAIAVVLAFAVMRFKKSVGIPVVVLALALVLVLGLFLQSIRAFTGDTPIATVRVLSAEKGLMRLELDPRGGEPVSLDLDGQYFAPIVKVVIFDDFFVFLGAKTWYRFEGMTSFDANMRQGKTIYRFPRPQGISEQLWSFFEQNEERIPGVKTAQVDMALKRVKQQKPAREFARYTITVQNDGGVEIVPAPGSD
jgi:hypothetical protein